jgi:hypothetical protein
MATGFLAVCLIAAWIVPRQRSAFASASDGGQDEQLVEVAANA